jgi:Flp pilus assembly pilin Flp
MARRLRQFWEDESGQDLIEYALLCGFVTTAAGVLLPGSIYTPFTQIFSKVSSLLDRFGSGGG